MYSMCCLVSGTPTLAVLAECSRFSPGQDMWMGREWIGDTARSRMGLKEGWRVIQRKWSEKKKKKKKQAWKMKSTNGVDGGSTKDDGADVCTPNEFPPKTKSLSFIVQCIPCNRFKWGNVHQGIQTLKANKNSYFWTTVRFVHETSCNPRRHNYSQGQSINMHTLLVHIQGFNNKQI